MYTVSNYEKSFYSEKTFRFSTEAFHFLVYSRVWQKISNRSVFRFGNGTNIWTLKTSSIYNEKYFRLWPI